MYSCYGLRTTDYASFCSCLSSDLCLGSRICTDRTPSPRRATRLGCRIRAAKPIVRRATKAPGCWPQHIGPDSEESATAMSGTRHEKKTNYEDLKANSPKRQDAKPLPTERMAHFTTDI